jgi:hypothetical protein
VDANKARQVIGVSATATPEEIDQAFREKASNAHPDRGGTDAAMAELLQARDLLAAMTPSAPSTQLIPISTVRELITLLAPPAATAVNQEETVSDAKKQIRARSVNHLKNYRLAAIIAAAVSSALIFVGKDAAKELFGHDVRITEAESLVASAKALPAKYNDGLDSLRSAAEDLEKKRLAFAALSSKKGNNEERERLKADLEDEDMTFVYRFSNLQRQIEGEIPGTRMMGAREDDPEESRLSRTKERLSVGRAAVHVAMLKDRVRTVSTQLGDEAQRSLASERRQISADTASWRALWLLSLLVSGGVSLVLTIRIKSAELSQEELGAELSTKSTAHALLRTIFTEVPARWSFAQLIEAVERWRWGPHCPYRQLIRMVGPQVVAQYVVGRCVQLQLLQIHEEISDKSYDEFYSLKAAG